MTIGHTALQELQFSDEQHRSQESESESPGAEQEVTNDCCTVISEIINMPRLGCIKRAETSVARGTSK